mmetsp:Transcript_49450/g.82927  ORF Transcript_49450/g.82927 Transcript_49450/m.82927 type:complete len:200 (+) Transcript_49450:483-1082(+)
MSPSSLSSPSPSTPSRPHSYPHLRPDPRPDSDSCCHVHAPLRPQSHLTLCYWTLLVALHECFAVFAMLCCAAQCCAVLCSVVLCCAVLCCVVLCMSCCVVLCFEQEHQHQMVHLTPGGNTDVARVGCREVVSNAICKWNRRACNQRSGYEQKDLCYYIHHRNTGKCLPGAHGVGPLYCLHNWNTSIAQSHENHAHNNSI